MKEIIDRLNMAEKDSAEERAIKSVVAEMYILFEGEKNAMEATPLEIEAKLREIMATSISASREAFTVAEQAVYDNKINFIKSFLKNDPSLEEIEARVMKIAFSMKGAEASPPTVHQVLKTVKSEFGDSLDIRELRRLIEAALL